MPDLTTETAASTPAEVPAQQQLTPLTRQEVIRIGRSLQQGNAQLVQQLVQSGRLARPSLNDGCRGENGWTLLHYCALGDSAEATGLLLDAGADPNAVDDCGWTALHQAADKNACCVAAELLARPECDPDRRCPKGRTPLMVAAESWRGSARMARLLLAAGASATAAAETAAAAAALTGSGKASMAALLAGSSPSRTASPTAIGLQPKRSRKALSTGHEDAKKSSAVTKPFGCGCGSAETRQCSCTNAIVRLSCRLCSADLLLQRLPSPTSVAEWWRQLAGMKRKQWLMQLLVAHQKKYHQEPPPSPPDMTEAASRDSWLNTSWRLTVLVRSDSPSELAMMEKIFLGRLQPSTDVKKWPAGRNGRRGMPAAAQRLAVLQIEDEARSED